jgi:hypothetical protein
VGRRTRLFGGFGAAAAICLALLLATTASRAAAPTLYVGDSPHYKVALAVAGAEHSVLELAGTAPCHFNEPREPAGVEPFSVFPAPVSMRRDTATHGFVSRLDGFPSANVMANFHHDRATGTYGYEESEESEHCEVHKAPFEARRYEPLGSPAAAGPKPGERRVYYDGDGPTHLFLRTSGKYLEGIRGAVAPECPLGSEGVPTRPLPLFGAPSAVKRDAKGRFHVRAHTSGRLRGGTYVEVVRFSGWMTKGAVTGTYLRVHTTKRRHQAPERCATGPLRFDATRYVPAKR